MHEIENCFPVTQQYFETKELACRCGCGQEVMDNNFMQHLIGLRVAINIPMQIHSGLRCIAHNKEVRGSSTSSHLSGRAVDVKATSAGDKMILVKAAINAGMTSIGIYDTFIHIALDPARKSGIFRGTF